MTRLNLPYVQRFKDRHGKERFYFRRAGYPHVPLPCAIGSPEFMDAYGRAAGLDRRSIKKYADGTVGALITAWYQSGPFKALAPSTQVVYRNIAERFGAEYGRLRARTLEKHNVEAIIAKRADMPAAANNLLKVLRMMMGFAVSAKLAPLNPTAGIKKLANKTDGHHTWTESEIERFEAHWEPGTRARLAFALLLYTAQRRGDVVRMGRQHVRDGSIFVIQEKTGAQLDIPLHQKLREIIDATPSEHLTFLTTASGAPFTSAGFGNLFREMCDDASLPKHCSAHGLRKAASRRLAEAGCTVHQIRAITGHASIAEVQRYTKAAEQKSLAKSAIAMTEGQKP